MDLLGRRRREDVQRVVVRGVDVLLVGRHDDVCRVALDGCGAEVVRGLLLGAVACGRGPGVRGLGRGREGSSSAPHDTSWMLQKA